MWTLECKGEVFLGRRHWLRPGATYVIGRSQDNPQVNFVIPQKSISRQHLIIRVEEVPKGNGLKTLARSTVTLEALKGTRVDGEELPAGDSKALDGTEHILHLGKYESAFKIKWNPIIFSFSLSSKERKDKKVMAARQTKAERFDIKTLEVYVASTTHVVASKRNTAIGLQALINGRYIVTEDYFDAIVKVATPGADNKALLEEDFDKYLPDPMQFVPPSGNEPNPRPKEYFAPKPERKTVFEGWLVIFCEKVQYENFLGPITDGGGKLERYDLIPGETTTRKLVDFFEKRGNERTAMVRFRGKGDTEEWCAKLSTEVSEILNLRMVEQNEFLDIILTCDTNDLRRPLEEEPAAPPSTAVTQTEAIAAKKSDMGPPAKPEAVSSNNNNDVAMGDASESAPAPRARRRLGARILQAKPKLEIMDFFSMPGDPLPPPPSSATQNLSYSSIPETQNESFDAQTARGAAQAVFADDGTAIAFTQNPSIGTMQNQSQTTSNVESTQTTRKRSPASDDDDPDLMNKLFPGAAAMKKRRLEQEGKESLERAKNSQPQEDTPMTEASPDILQAKAVEAQSKTQSKTPTKGRKGKTLDPIIEAARANIKEEEEKKRRETQLEDIEPFDEETLNAIKGLGLVEFTVEVRSRDIATIRARAYGDDSNRWDPRWNGRANFKKFRKRSAEDNGEEEGIGGGMTSVRGNVIIPLVEHKGHSDFDSFPDFNSPRKVPLQTTNQTPPPPPEPEEEPYPDEHEDAPASVFSKQVNRSRATRATPSQTITSQTTRVRQSQFGSSSATIFGDSPSSATTVGSSSSKRVGATKRGSPGNLTLQEPAQKRAKGFFLMGRGEDEDSSDDEDRLKFSFRKRR